MKKISIGNNLFGEIPAVLTEELVQPLITAPAVRIEKIVSRGHCSSVDFWYDQEIDEFVALLKGSAGIRFEGRREILELRPGDTLNIPAHVRHQVVWTDPEIDTVWLAVHYRA